MNRLVSRHQFVFWRSMATLPCLLLALIFLTQTELRSQPPESRSESGKPEKGKEAPTPPPSLQEARVRAKLLHEMSHGALQVMHRDFFHEEKSLHIPSRTLEDVFEEMKAKHGVQLRWLAVNAAAMSIDNKPATEFEQAAVKAISAGNDEYEAVEDGQYRFVGRIQLSSECLKCHMPFRTSTKDRAAGLLISMPVKTAD